MTAETKMLIRMSGTVVTSKDSIVLGVQPDQVPKPYQEDVSRIWADVLRFNFPSEYSTKLGSRYNGVFYHRVGDECFFSCHDLDISDEYNTLRLRPYSFKLDGNPRTNLLNNDTDDQFFLIPNEYSPFKKGDNIKYEYVEQYEDGDKYIERHIKCTRR
jgi:hypothetical protein